MLHAKDIMTPNPVTVRPEIDILQAARLLLEKGYNGLPVVDAQGVLKGVLCQSDLISQQKRLKLPSLFTLLDGFFPISSTDAFERELKRMTATTVADAMSDEPVWVTPDTSIEDVATLMVDRKLHTLPVLDNGKLVGIIGKEDVLRALVAAQDQPVKPGDSTA